MTKIVVIIFLWQLCFLGLYGQQPLSIAETKIQLDKSATGSERARLLCKLALLYVHKQGENKSDLDSALLLTKQAAGINAGLNDKSIEARINYVNGNALREMGDTALAHAAINRSLAIFNTIPDCAEHGEALLELSNYCPTIQTKEGVQARKECFERALEQFRAAGDQEKQADALKNIADFNQLLRNYGLSIINLREALSIYTSIGYKNMQGVYDLLGIVSTNLGDYANAIKYGLLAVQTAENNHDTSIQLCTVYNRLGIAYGNWSKWNEGIFYMKKALAVANKYHDRDAIETVLLTLCYMKAGQRDWKETLSLIKTADKDREHWTLADSLYMAACYIMTYTEAGNLNAAMPYINLLANKIPGAIDAGLPLHIIYSQIANYYLAAGNYILAKKYALLNKANAIRNGNRRTIAISYLLEARADSGLGNFRDAMREYQVNKRMADSMASEAKNLQFAQMQVIYETDKKDKEIQIKKQDIELLTSKSKLQEFYLKRASLTRNLIIIISVLLLGLLYMGYRFKQRHNNKLQLQQQQINKRNEQLRDLLSEKERMVEEKEWLVKEIHHRVKNNLQIVISLLNAQADFLDNNPSALSAIRNSRERMQAIALIHQKLYQPGHNTLIDMDAYVPEMLSFFSSSFADTEKISFQQDVDHISLDVSQAVPVGLILNEAITNSVKYAFKETGGGTISISLKHTDDQHILLRIADNGKGLPSGFDFSASNSLGIQLIKLFAEQLEADLQFEKRNGVQITMIFKNIYRGNTNPAF